MAAVQECEHTIKYYGYCDDPGQKKRVLVLQYLNVNDLEASNRILDEVQIWQVFSDVAKALQCIEKQGYVHQGNERTTCNRLLLEYSLVQCDMT